MQVPDSLKRRLKTWGVIDAVRRTQGFVRDSYLGLRRDLRTRGQAVPAGEPSFLLVRILGNDLYPRHARDQTPTNLRFLLEREPAFPRCRKLFIVNRIFDPAREAELIGLLERHGADYLRVPFEPEAFANLTWNWSLHDPEYFRSNAFAALSRDHQIQARLWAAAPLIRYAMNVNGARNLALSQGRQRADWTLPFDGNCYFSAEAFEAMRQSCASAPFAPHLVVPMLRQRPASSSVNAAMETAEPQLAFHASSRVDFDESFPYGIMDKAHLLKWLGVPGPWHAWRLSRVPRRRLPDRSNFKHSLGAVVRLSEGRHGMQETAAGDFIHRSRNDSILRTLRELIETYGIRDPEHAQLVLGDGRWSEGASAVGRHSARMATGTELKDSGKLKGRLLFIGIGAQKSGTTWVANYLRAHPEAFVSRVKEIDFFNTLRPNLLEGDGQLLRIRLINNILLDYHPHEKMPLAVRQELRDLAEISHFAGDGSRYLRFFAERVGDQKVFGEISPSYALLPADAYRDMVRMHEETRLFFIMRDPAARAVSQINHLARRDATASPDYVWDKVRAVAPGDRVYERSNYAYTLRALADGVPDGGYATFIYEELFQENTIRKLCGFLGISYVEPRFDMRVNASAENIVTAKQQAEIRKRLDPVYKELATLFGKNRPDSWAW